MRYLLGADLGTTAIKVALFDEKGKKISDSTQEYMLYTPTPLIVELGAEVYWNAFKTGVAESLKQAGVAAEDIVSLSISAQGETLLLLDKDGKPLRNAIVWMDNRAQEESDDLEKHFSNETIHSITGQVAMLAMWPAAKILWLKNHERQVFDDAMKFLLVEDYFFYRLSGKFFGEGSLWCSTIMWDINTKRYWPEMLDYLGVREEQLPEIVESGTPLGKILPEVARELGLSPDTELVMGALDQACGAIGVGNVRVGIFSESTGAALAVVAVVDKPVFDENREMPCFYYGIPDMYMIHAFTTGGIVFKWLRDSFCSEELAIAERTGVDAYAFMDMEAMTVPAGSDGLVVLPHFQGSGPPDSDQKAKGVVYGLSLNHTKAHMIRAFMEAVAMNMCRMIEATSATGIEITEIRSHSGGAKSPVWCQIKADAAGIPVHTMKNTADAACLGAAVLAGVASGIWKSVPEAMDSIVEEDKVYMPDPGNKKVYDNLYNSYKELMAVLKPFVAK